MNPTTIAAGIDIVPWLFSGLLLLGGAFLAWKVGLPAVRILALEQHIKLLETQLQAAEERAKVAELRNNELQRQLAEALDELKSANRRIAAFLTVVELKSGAKESLT